MNDIAASILIGVVTATVSSWITVQLSFRRFRSERWWERKVAAYERVIEALHHSKAFSDAHLNAVYEGRELAEDRDKELRGRARESGLEVIKAADVGGFLLSRKAHARLQKYREDIRQASNTDDWIEYLENDLVATESCLSDLIQMAKEDLHTG